MTCANPACGNPLPAANRTGRPAIYCSPACRPSHHRHRDANPDNPTRTTPTRGSDTGTVTVELDHPTTSPDGRLPQRVWTVRLRRGQHHVIIAEGLGWPTASALARQLDALLAPSPATTTRDNATAIPQIQQTAVAQHRVAHAGDEWARPGEHCSCGRPAVVVFLTKEFGRVAFCGIPDAKPLPASHTHSAAID